MDIKTPLTDPQRTLLRSLWTPEGLTRREIEEELGCSRPTVDKALGLLRGLGLIESCGMRTPQHDRPAEVFSVCESAWFALGLNLELPNADLVVVDAWGEILHETRLELRERLETPRGTIVQIAELIRDWVDGLAVPMDRVIGLGVGIPGVFVDRRVTFVGRHLPNWKQVPVESSLESDLSLPVLVNHDVHFMALAEIERRGWADRIVLYVSIRPGLDGDMRIGASLCVRGRVYRGSHGNAGALFRAIVDAEELADLSENGRVERIAERLTSSLVHVIPLVDPDWVVVHAESLGSLETPLVQRCIEDLEVALQGGEYVGMTQVTSASVRGATGAQQAAIAVIRELLRPEGTSGVEGGIRQDREHRKRIKLTTTTRGGVQ